MTSLISNFQNLGLPDSILQTIEKLGYKEPSPIQAKIIPDVMAGRDVLGQAQTGTGKTAAFALPLISRLAEQNIKLKPGTPQVLILAPTRELAIQVAESCKKYAQNIKNFKILPIYGGQDYTSQLRALKAGINIVVGTPGRVMDHMRRGSLDLSNLECLVLDEADEMLRMGFIESVEWVLEHTPKNVQIALFSATMPPAIAKIAENYLKNPSRIKIKSETTTAPTITQKYWSASGPNKLDALIRILETEDFDGVIIFVRTKAATIELAERLTETGRKTAALNGDVAQNTRERIIREFKAKTFDLLIATDVAARGLDVDRISHVINYDMPNDIESYVHRIGRTGRAGRSGVAILFISPRERFMLNSIERSTKQPIELLEMPSTEEINNKRIEKFKARILNTIEKHDLGFFKNILETLELPAIDIAAALAKILQGNKPFLMSNRPRVEKYKPELVSRSRNRDREFKKPSYGGRSQENMQKFRIEVGRQHGVKPKNIVGAIANEANLHSSSIGDIRIQDNFSTVDLPRGISKSALQILEKTWVAGKQLRISKIN